MQVVMTSPSNQAEAFVEYVEHELKMMQKSLRETVKDGKKKAVHKTRVASRRLETALEIARPTLSRDELKPIVKFARKVRRQLGKLRDLQVMRESLRSRGRDVAKPVVKAIDDRIDLMGEKIRRKLSSADLPRQSLSAAALTSAIRRSLPAIESPVRNALRDALQKFDHDARNLDIGDGKAHDVHRLRVALKQARYALEIATAMGIVSEGAIGRHLQQAQDRLGAWHDAAVIAAFIADHLVEDRTLERDPLAAAEYLSVACAISAESLEALRKFEMVFRRGRSVLTRTVNALGRKSNGHDRRQ
jgi:CHAD domain-containing protein